MCFSATADLVGGLVISAIGVDALRNVGRRCADDHPGDCRHDHVAFALLPLLFGLHQLTETFVWWGLDGTLPHGVGRVATYVYLLFAFVVLPTYVPVAIRALEPPGRRRTVMDVFVAVGAVVSALLLLATVRGPVSAELAGHHIEYSVNLPASVPIVGAYVAVTCLSAVFSGYHLVARFGLVNLVAVAVIAFLAVNGFASIWCAWAAVASLGIALHIRYGRPHRTVVEALA